MFAGNAVPIYF